MLGYFVAPSATPSTAAVPCEDQAACDEANKKAYARVVGIDRSPATQAKRKDLIERMITERLISKVEVPGSLPRVLVLPRFYTLTFDDRQRTVSVVSAYMGQPGDDYLVRVFDARTNRSIGRFTQQLGLVIDSVF
jgi:hypothetical protein